MKTPITIWHNPRCSKSRETLALLKSKGIPVDCHHLNVRFAHKIGVPLYEMICEKRALFGEWLFSYLLFRDNPKRAEDPRVFKPVFEQIARESGQSISFFEDMSTRTAPQFLTWAMTAIDWSAAIGVSPTSMPCMIATMILFASVPKLRGAMPACAMMPANRPQIPSASPGSKRGSKSTAKA